MLENHLKIVLFILVFSSIVTRFTTLESLTYDKLVFFTLSLFKWFIILFLKRLFLLSFIHCPLTKCDKNNTKDIFFHLLKNKAILMINKQYNFTLKYHMLLIWYLSMFLFMKCRIYDCISNVFFQKLLVLIHIKIILNWF